MAGAPLDPAKPRFLTVAAGGRLGARRARTAARPGAGGPRNAPQIADLLRAAERLPARRRGVAGARRGRRLARLGRLASGGGARPVQRSTPRSDRSTGSRARARSQQGGGTSARWTSRSRPATTPTTSSTTRTSGSRQLLEGGQSLAPNSGVKSSYTSAAPISDAALSSESSSALPNEPIYTGVAGLRRPDGRHDHVLRPEPAAGHVRRMAEIQRPDGPRAADRSRPSACRRGATAVPTYLANGNHDGLVQGNQASTSLDRGDRARLHKAGRPEPRIRLDHQSLTFFVRPDPERQTGRQGAAEGASTPAGTQADGHGFGARRRGAEHRLETAPPRTTRGTRSRACASSRSTRSPRAASSPSRPRATSTTRSTSG